MPSADHFRKLLKECNVDPFVSQVFGATLGTLADHGLTDQEIVDLTQHLLEFIRRAIANPESAPLMAQFLELNRRNI